MAKAKKASGRRVVVSVHNGTMTLLRVPRSVKVEVRDYDAWPGEGADTCYYAGPIDNPDLNEKAAAKSLQRRFQQPA